MKGQPDSKTCPQIIARIDFTALSTCMLTTSNLPSTKSPLLKTFPYEGNTSLVKNITRVNSPVRTSKATKHMK